MLLHAAALDSPLAACQALVAYGSDCSVCAPRNFEANPQTADVDGNGGCSAPVRLPAGSSVLHVLCREHSSSSDVSLTTALRLIEANAPVHAVDASGVTALHLAARAGALELAATLVGAGAAVGAEDAEGRTALHGLPEAAAKTLLGRIRHPPPPANAKACQQCSTKFTTLGARRHHCHHCGRTLCAACCSSTKVVISKFKESAAARVCSLCVDLIG